LSDVVDSQSKTISGLKKENKLGGEVKKLKSEVSFLMDSKMESEENVKKLSDELTMVLEFSQKEMDSQMTEIDDLKGIVCEAFVGD
jgi:transposase